MRGTIAYNKKSPRLQVMLWKFLFSSATEEHLRYTIEAPRTQYGRRYLKS